MKRYLVGLLPLVGMVPLANAQEQGTGNYYENAPVNNEIPETYIVQPGDTLWDISASILQNPWYWPKIWSYNPDITNPHMIYPGDTIKFTQQSGQQMPTLAQYASSPNAFGGDEDGTNNDNNTNSAANNGYDQNGNPTVVSRPVFEVISDEATSHRAPGTVQVMVESLLTKNELEQSGVIYKSAEERILLKKGDKIYLKFPSGYDVSIGEKYQIFRTVEKIKHPESKDFIGYLTQITGMCEIINVGDKVATAIIRQGANIIERGQFVTPMAQDVYRLVEPKANESTVEGVIITTKFNETTLIGEQEIVFIDKGSKDGIKLGNTLDVVYQGDPLFGVDKDLPEEVIGTLRVVDVKENISTAIVLNAIREIEKGVRVIMKP